MNRLNKIYQNLAHEKIFTITCLDQGLSNENYKVNDRYVLRVKNLENSPFYNAKVEFQAMHDIRHLHLDICCVNHDKYGNKITIFEPLVKNFDPEHYTLKQIKQIAQAIKDIHNTPTQVKAKFEYFKRIKFYKFKSGHKLDRDLENNILEMAHRYFDNASLCLCHNDLVQGNILFIEDELRIIDYEFASLNDPWFDIASFLSENNILSRKAVVTFLKTYFKDDFREYHVEKLKDYFILLDYLWYHWAIMMFTNTEKDIYLKIANVKLGRIRYGVKFE